MCFPRDTQKLENANWKSFMLYTHCIILQVLLLSSLSLTHSLIVWMPKFLLPLVFFCLTRNGLGGVRENEIYDDASKTINEWKNVINSVTIISDFIENPKKKICALIVPKDGKIYWISSCCFSAEISRKAKKCYRVYQKISIKCEEKTQWRTFQKIFRCQRYVSDIKIITIITLMCHKICVLILQNHKFFVDSLLRIWTWNFCD